MTSDSGPEGKFWQIALVDLERKLSTGRSGLSSAEAAARRLRYGPNTLGERRRLSLPLKFLSRFRNPLVIILLAAAVISALTGDLTSFIIISTIVLMSAVLDTVQEFRAEQAAEHLKVSVALKEQVLRDGQEITVPGQDLVSLDLIQPTSWYRRSSRLNCGQVSQSPATAKEIRPNWNTSLGV